MQTAIVTAVDANYLPAACCALLSCVGDGAAKAQAKFFLLACGVAVGDAEKTHNFLESRGLPVEIVMVATDRLQPFWIDGYVSVATYARLLLPDFFDDRWDRVLYLDADTRSMVPLQPLLCAILHGKPVGAVHDYLRYMIYGMEECRKRLSLRSDAPYFNAGIMCFDWRATIASGLLLRARAYATESAHLCKSHDQDALNKAFEGAWTPLDPRWNFMTVAIPEDVFRLYYPPRLRPNISHFAGPLKPWMGNFPERFEHHRAWYRDLLRGSPWPHFAEQDSPLRTPWPPGRVRVKRWLMAQRVRLQAAFERRLHAETAAAQHTRNVDPRESPLIEASQRHDANPELEHLLDNMIAEAAGS
jgi:lipopolysaccharide biosynthesis glycosyltransferase